MGLRDIRSPGAGWNGGGSDRAVGLCDSHDFEGDDDLVHKPLEMPVVWINIDDLARGVGPWRCTSHGNHSSTGIDSGFSGLAFVRWRGWVASAWKRSKDARTPEFGFAVRSMRGQKKLLTSSQRQGALGGCRGQRLSSLPGSDKPGQPRSWLRRNGPTGYQSQTDAGRPVLRR